MDAKRLLDLVSLYKENRDFIQNEEATKMALIVPFISALGYNPNSPREVRLEYAADFTQGDGKRYPDRMDYAIFDQTGSKPLMVIEAKPLGAKLETRSAQLARYIGQLADLHFGILTDGCTYLFFGDLDNPNQMDRDPFFSFSLADENENWVRVGDFLSKFSRDAFNPDTLITDAENSRYRTAMITKLAIAIKDPAADEGFMRWLTEDIYRGKRTTNVMQRLGQIAKESIEPALMSVLEDNFVDQLRQRFQKLRDVTRDPLVDEPSPLQPTAAAPADSTPRAAAETTQDELHVYSIVRQFLLDAGADPSLIYYKDTVHYFSVSYKTRWLIRFFGNSRRKAIVTPLPVETVKSLVSQLSIEVEPAPPVFGMSRIYLESVDQVGKLRALVIRCWEAGQAAPQELS